QVAGASFWQTRLEYAPLEHPDGAGLAGGKMNILFFVSSMHAGGAERVAATLTSAWAAQGHRVTLVPTYTRRGKLFYSIDSRVRLEWVADSMGWLARTPFAPLVKLWVLRRMLKRERPDVVIS